MGRVRSGKPLRIGIVVGEPSGDLLGAGLVAALKRRLPAVDVEGICGPRMQALGCRTLFEMERISLVGFDGLIGKVREILRIRRVLVNRFLADPPDVFVGVDVPDFNLALERRLKAAGIPTIHYVSPTVWAWRGYRIRKIKRAVGHMLTLFPFEADFYRRHRIPVSFVGHPMADEIPETTDRSVARAALGLAANRRTLALLPGSRVAEVRRLAPQFIETAARLRARYPDLQFVVPLANAECRRAFAAAQQTCPVRPPPLHEIDGRAREAIVAADVVLLASGTATLETALLRRPMVVAYRVSWPSYWLIRLFAHVDLYAMPNHLSGRQVVPEYMQGDATAAKLSQAVADFLDDPHAVAGVTRELARIHAALKGDANTRAAQVVIEQVERRRARRDQVGDVT